MTGSNDTSEGMIRTVTDTRMHVSLYTVLPYSVPFDGARVPDFILTPADCHTVPDLGFGHGSAGWWLVPPRPGAAAASGPRWLRAAVVCDERAERSLRGGRVTAGVSGAFIPSLSATLWGAAQVPGPQALFLRSRVLGGRLRLAGI